MDREAWQTTVHVVIKNQTPLSDLAAAAAAAAEISRKLEIPMEHFMQR